MVSDASASLPPPLPFCAGLEGQCPMNRLARWWSTPAASALRLDFAALLDRGRTGGGHPAGAGPGEVTVPPATKNSSSERRAPGTSTGRGEEGVHLRRVRDVEQMTGSRDDAIGGAQG